MNSNRSPVFFVGGSLVWYFSWQDQVQIAKFVPEVFLQKGILIRRLNVCHSRQRLEDGKVRSLGLVKAGQEAVDGPEPAAGRDHEAGPTFAGMHVALRVRHALQRAYDGGANRQYAAPVVVCPRNSL